jgi:hypothetical protein
VLLEKGGLSEPRQKHRQKVKGARGILFRLVGLMRNTWIVAGSWRTFQKRLEFFAAASSRDSSTLWLKEPGREQGLGIPGVDRLPGLPLDDLGADAAKEEQVGIDAPAELRTYLRYGEAGKLACVDSGEAR